jgi:chaperonin GroEL (HSP60 family)
MQAGKLNLFYQQMLQYVTAGANPIAIKHGIDKTCNFLVAKLKENAKPVKGRTDIKV